MGAGGSDGTTGAVYDATTNVLTVSVALNDTVANVASAIDTEGTFTTSNASGTFNVADFGTQTDPLSGGEGTGLAADLGYSDQSHLVTEFRSLTGLTPGRWIASRPAGSKSPSRQPFGSLL